MPNLWKQSIITSYIDFADLNKHIGRGNGCVFDKHTDPNKAIYNGNFFQK